MRILRATKFDLPDRAHYPLYLIFDQNGKRVIIAKHKEDGYELFRRITGSEPQGYMIAPYYLEKKIAKQ